MEMKMELSSKCYQLNISYFEQQNLNQDRTFLSIRLLTARLNIGIFEY